VHKKSSKYPGQNSKNLANTRLLSNSKSYKLTFLVNYAWSDERKLHAKIKGI
jgi:hypothetical protein